jgi:hypothetical protein
MGSSLVTAGDDNWTDYSVSADVRKLVYHHAAVVGRVNGANQFYGLFLATNLNKWQLVKKNGSGQHVVLDEGPYVADNANYYNLKLNFSGDTITAYVDGVEVGSAVDTTFSDGKIGLYTNPSAAYYDNVVVE